jgi:hypothetical protein
MPGKGDYVAGSPGKRERNPEYYKPGYGEKKGEDIAPPETFRRSGAGKGGFADIARQEAARRKKLEEERKRKKAKEEADAIAAAERK